MAARCPHPATVVADVGGVAVAASVLPWSGAGGQPGWVWAGDRLGGWLADALAAIRVSDATVWGGDRNRNLAGCWQSVGTARSDAVGAMGLVAATAALPHTKRGLYAIDHIAVPVSQRVAAARLARPIDRLQCPTAPKDRNQFPELHHNSSSTPVPLTCPP